MGDVIADRTAGVVCDTGLAAVYCRLPASPAGMPPLEKLGRGYGLYLKINKYNYAAQCVTRYLMFFRELFSDLKFLSNLFKEKTHTRWQTITESIDKIVSVVNYMVSTIQGCFHLNFFISSEIQNI